MIITLKAFRDLGRCSYGTLRETFDTERDVIYDNDKKVEITKVEDLFPYLWQAAGISGHTPDGTFAHFHGGDTHWHRDFDPSVKRCDGEIKKLKKKIAKSNEPAKREKWCRLLDDETSHRDHLLELMRHDDEEMAKLQKLLISENQN